MFPCTLCHTIFIIIIIIFPPAEVQQAATEHDRVEMDRLRHKLMANFQQQMELRQQMMEVENQKWEISVEASRHFSNIAE